MSPGAVPENFGRWDAVLNDPKKGVNKPFLESVFT